MTDIQDQTVTTFDALNAFFDRCDRFEGWVYRGQSDSRWPLVPKITRTPIIRELLAILSHGSVFDARAGEIARKIDELRPALERANSFPDELRDFRKELEESHDLSATLSHYIEKVLLQAEATTLEL